MNHITFHKTKIALLIMLAMGLPTVVCAAEEGADEEKDFGKIVVTATKRPQMAQDVPIALTAVSEDMLENAGITDVADLRDIVAGLEIESNGQGRNKISARGVTSSSGGESVQSNTSVGYYLDETPISAFATMMPEIGIWDAERIEMLRGPQGTLFGEGSMAGTIRVISNKPDTGEFEAEVYARGSKTHLGGNNSNFRGKINLPLIEEVLALRIIAGNDEDGGWVDVPDQNAKDVNSHKQTDAKMSLRWTPSEELTVDFSYTYQKLDVEGDPKETTRGELLPIDGLTVPDYAALVGAAGEISTRDEDYNLTSLTIEYDLGWASLVSATAMFDLESDFDEDISEVSGILWAFYGTPFDSTVKQPGQIEIEMMTQELRLVSNNDSNFNWTIGGFYKTSDRVLVSGIGVYAPEIPYTGEAFAHQIYKADSFALFGELSWMFNETVELKVGGRYYSEDRDLLTTDMTTWELLGVVAGTENPGTGDDSEFSPMVHISWNVSDDVMLFARYAEGFKAGGINTNYAIAESFAPGSMPQTFDSEKLATSEVGIKTNISPNFQLNAYVYISDWTDLQLGNTCCDGFFNYTKNAGSASATGAELEILSRPMDGLTLSFSSSIIHAQIDEDVLDDYWGDVLIPKGNKIPLVPEITYSASATYSFPVSDTLSGLGYLGYSHRDEAFTDIGNTPDKLNDEFNNLKLRLGVEGDSWGVYVFADNLLDEDSTISVSDMFGLLMYKNYVRPRTIGVEASYTFY